MRAEVWQQSMRGDWLVRIWGGSNIVFRTEGYVNKSHAINMILKYSRVKAKNIKIVPYRTRLERRA